MAETKVVILQGLKRIALVVVLISLSSAVVCAETAERDVSNAESVRGLFSDELSPSDFYNGRRISAPEAKAAVETEVPAEPEPRSTKPASKYKPVFVTNDPASHLRPPDEDPVVRINPEAPGPMIGLVTCFQQGDQECAEAYADQFVRYMLNLVYEVRSITQLIGEALIRNGVVDEEEWVGVEQYIDWEHARARAENNTVLKPTHEESLKRITQDPGGGADIYYFFTLSCSWCRYMAPDIERLWRIAQADPKLKMHVMLIGESEKDWIRAYSEFAGFSMPILDGTEAAKALRIGFVPALVVASPANKQAYLKTGQQDFKRLYEFVRTVQGLPTELTPVAVKLMKTTIGEAEKLSLQEQGKRRTVHDAVLRMPANRVGGIRAEKISIEKF